MILFCLRIVKYNAINAVSSLIEVHERREYSLLNIKVTHSYRVYSRSLQTP